MVTFLALYRGPSVAEAEVLGLTADPELIADFATRLLQRSEQPPGDSVLEQKHRAQRRALRLIRTEAARRMRGPG